MTPSWKENHPFIIYLFILSIDISLSYLWHFLPLTDFLASNTNLVTQPFFQQLILFLCGLIRELLTSHLYTGSLPLSFRIAIHRYYSIWISVLTASQVIQQSFVSGQTLSVPPFFCFSFLFFLAQRAKTIFHWQGCRCLGSRVLNTAQANNAI